MAVLMKQKTTRSRAVARVADRTAYIRRPVSYCPSRKEINLSEWLQSHTRYGDAAISNATINARIWYGN